MTTQVENDFDKLETWFKCNYGDIDEEDDSEDESEPEEKDDSGEE